MISLWYFKHDLNLADLSSILHIVFGFFSRILLPQIIPTYNSDPSFYSIHSRHSATCQLFKKDKPEGCANENQINAVLFRHSKHPLIIEHNFPFWDAKSISSDPLMPHPPNKIKKDGHPLWNDHPKWERQITRNSIWTRISIIAHSSMDISRFCKQSSNRLNTSVTITVTWHIPAGNPMIGETPIGILSGFYGIIVNRPDTIFILHGISYLIGWVVNWFVNVRSSGMMKSAGEWNWKVCLGWILENQEEGIWGWFRLFFSQLYWSCGAFVYSWLISNWTLEFYGKETKLMEFYICDMKAISHYFIITVG